MISDGEEKTSKFSKNGDNRSIDELNKNQWSRKVKIKIDYLTFPDYY